MAGYGLSTQARARLDHFLGLLQLEKKELAQQLAALTAGGQSERLAEEGRIASSLGMHGQSVTDTGGIRIDLAAPEGALRDFRGRRGDVVVVCPRGAVSENVTGIISGRGANTLTVDIDGTPPAPGTVVDVVMAPDDRTLDALIRLTQTLRASPRPAPLIEILLGAATVARTPPADLPALDARLNADQRRAIGLALSRMPAVLVHGPFGTGKTRTLVEIVRLLVADGQSVLCLAASNAGIDHLALELLARDPALPLLRLGRAARTSPDLEPALLDTQLAREGDFAVLTNALGRTVEALAGDPHNARLKALIERWTRGLREARQRYVQSRLASFRVVCGTLTGVSGDLDAVVGRHLFDVLVVDEASQAITPALFFGACFARRIILAGDHCQLPPTVLSPLAVERGLARSGFESLMRAGAVPSHMLTEQYRCNETLMTFPSRQFYGNRLTAHANNRTITLADGHLGLTPTEQRNLAAALEVCDTAGRHWHDARDGSNSLANKAEATCVADYVTDYIKAGLPARDIGVITPYAAQARLLRQRLAAHPDVDVDTVDAFQGREKELIVVSCVRSNPRGAVGFVADVRRINVLLTRARRRLIVVGDAATLGTDPVWQAFWEWARTVGHVHG